MALPYLNLVECSEAPKMHKRPDKVFEIVSEGIGTGCYACQHGTEAWVEIPRALYEGRRFPVVLDDATKNSPFAKGFVQTYLSSFAFGSPPGEAGRQIVRIDAADKGLAKKVCSLLTAGTENDAEPRGIESTVLRKTRAA